MSYHIDPLQDATEAMCAALRDLPYSVAHRLRIDAPGFLEAVEEVASVSGTSHIGAPQLRHSDRIPERVPEEGIFDAIFDDQPPRKLSDVWEGRGDYDDPFQPQDLDKNFTNTTAVEYDHDLLAKRMREDSDKSLDYPFTRG